MDGTRAHAEAIDGIARAFRVARLEAVALDQFPVAVPGTLAEAYRVQDEAIAAFPDQVGGWKIAGIQPQFRPVLGAERLAGPVMAAGIRHAGPESPVPFAVFEDGFAALEAEFIFVMGRDIRPGEDLSDGRLADAVGSMFAGAETAGSPLGIINDIGPLAVISDFGNNSGVIVGGEIAGWRSRDLSDLTASVTINGEAVGSGSAANVAGGPLAALRFLVGNLGARGITLRAGEYVSTGMTTGIHAVKPGDMAHFEFCDGIRFRAEAIRARPMTGAGR
ncbi:MAG TPA: hypothetical protein PKW21_07935 [Rhabdaerophilum sp.]|nr:hypothetical protein [Rhabdaerophilum sp.]